MTTTCIIGGGYTGLVAALRLAQAGQQVTVLEATNTFGGLASGFRIEGEPIEKAYHHLFRTDTSIITLAEELGVGPQLDWHTSKTGLYYNGKLYPFAGAIDLATFSPVPFFERIRTGLIYLRLQRDAKWKKYIPVSALEWMRQHGGEHASAVIWEPLLKGKFDRYFDKVSMAWLWARIHTRANSKAKGELTEKLGYFDGGFQVFTDALTARLQELGVRLVPQAKIAAITTTEGCVHVQHELDDVPNDFDHLVATVPSYVFSKLIRDDPHADEQYHQQLTSIDYIGARILVFSSKQDLTPYYWHNINDVSLPFLVFLKHTNLIDKARYRDFNIYYVAAYYPHDTELFTMPDQQLRDLWVENLKKIFPNFDPQQIHEEHLFTFRNAQHIVDTNYEQKIPDFQTPLPNVYLSNFSQIYPEDRGTNFAVAAGESIAERILSHED